jgi:hypothetical protein
MASWLGGFGGGGGSGAGTVGAAPALRRQRPAEYLGELARYVRRHENALLQGRPKFTIEADAYVAPSLSHIYIHKTDGRACMYASYVTDCSCCVAACRHRRGAPGRVAVRFVLVCVLCAGAPHLPTPTRMPTCLAHAGGPWGIAGRGGGRVCAV